MYIIDDVAYAGEIISPLKVIAVKTMEDYKLWIKFSNNEQRIFDFKPLLAFPCYEPLKEETVFNSVFIERGIVVWEDGNIDIAPEKLYEDGAIVKDEISA